MMNMMNRIDGRISLFGLRVSRELHDFVVSEALPGTGVDAGKFWEGFADIVHDLGPKNRALLEKRDDFQL
ncbi:malate synthase, partial [Aminobacter sp. AP02]